MNFWMIAAVLLAVSILYHSFGIVPKGIPVKDRISEILTYSFVIVFAIPFDILECILKPIDKKWHIRDRAAKRRET